MHAKSLLPKLSAIIFLLVALFIALPQGDASAHSMRPLSACSSSPSPANCNGQDPQTTGCSSGATTVMNGYVIDNFDHTTKLLFIELRWSPTCLTNWTRISNLVDVPSGGSEGGEVWNCNHQDWDYSFGVNGPLPKGSTEWTPMVYANTDPAASYGVGVSGTQQGQFWLRQASNCPGH